MKTDLGKNKNHYSLPSTVTLATEEKEEIMNGSSFILEELLMHKSDNNKVSIRNNSLTLSATEKLERIKNHIHGIMTTLGLDMTDDSLRDTPLRVAKMYLNETFSGLDTANEPKLTLFNNDYQYTQMLLVKDITIHSTCEHHLVPFYGKAHIAYFSSGKVIGLSKLNRVAKYFSSRPQVQERLTVEISNALKQALGTEDIAIVIEANHLCVSSRGAQDANSSTTTAEYSGKFLNYDIRNEFLSHLKK